MQKLTVVRSPAGRKLAVRVSGNWRITVQPRAAGEHRVNRDTTLKLGAYLATVLQEKRDGEWRDWMTDDPLYYWAMQSYATQSRGTVVILGLGLGLVLHHLASNEDVERIVVVERQPEVIDMVWSAVNDDPRVELVRGDFFDMLPILRDIPATTFIADPWVGSPLDPAFQELFLRVYDAAHEAWPEAQGFYHGVDPWAVALLSDPQNRERLPELAEAWV